MELVYLWIEDYKNIYRQGFHFSPKFECEFQAKYYSIGNSNGGLKEKVSSNSPLSIFTKLSDSLFPSNVNITTIVGKNGTGKSRILKLLYSLYNNSLENDTNCFAIFYDDKQEQYFYLGNENKFNCLKQYTKLSNTAFALFDYSLTYQPEFNYAEDEFIYPKKKIRSLKGAISLTQELIRNQKNILLNYCELAKNNQLDKFKDFFVAETIVIEFNNERFQHTINDKKGLLENKKQEIINEISSIFIGQRLTDFIEKLKEIQNILNNQDSFEKKDPSVFFPDWFQWCERMEQDNQIENLWNKDFSRTVWNRFTEDKTIAPQKFYQEIVEDGENNVPSYKVLSYEVKNLTQELIEILLTSFGQEYFTIKIIDKNEKVLNDLSFGEQQLIFILNQLFALKYEKFLGIEEVEGQDVDVEKDIKNFIVLLDEIDIGFHPDWQKKVIQHICDFLKLIPEKNFHLVFTTHSPFLLSDLAKENVMFLDKDEKTGNCKNVTEKTNIETFGANIHTLLSHGFFMSKGLIGEFAQERINEAITYLNQKVLSKKDIGYCENIISIIGEPILKRQLQKMLDSKRLAKVDKIDEIEKQILELQNKLEQIKND